MRTRRSDSFTTITVAGQVLPADLLQRIADKDKELGGLGADSYHLSPSETISEATSRAWNKLVAAWANFKSARQKLPANDPRTTATRERWLLPLFQELGYGRLPASRSAVEIDRKGYAISHWWSSVPIHLVGVGVSIDRLSARIAGAARSSPHSLVQELLNRSEESLWGFVSNGSQLRILRDNQNLVRQAYLEFDLEAMMDGEAYSDFVMLWLLCHQSRVEAEKPNDYWLEKWSRAAQEGGVRALEHLREGVEEAISLLGSGFLAHRANANLRDKLRSGLLDKQDYYRQLLRLVYRLLFLFVAEDRTDEKNRSLLLDPNASQEACDLYSKFYSTKKLRELAGRRHGSRHSDLYAGVRLVMEKLGSDDGCAELALPALGSFLFSQNAIADLNEGEIANHDLLDAVRALAFATDKQARRQIDYKNLGSEELGSVYESLLELHPQLNIDAATFALSTAAGHERKTTGSYYTPDSLVQYLIDSALDPVLDDRERNHPQLGYKSTEEAILDLKVCDPACGSGHFLIAAAHRIAKRLAAIRTGDNEPSPESTRHALRDVVGRCLYGVDINPMAVELCKVSLWMEAIEPGRPLSFLDHHILCGNSLLGTTPALVNRGIPDEAFKPIEGDDKKLCAEYRKQNKRERKQETLRGFHGDPWDQLGNLATSLMSIDEIADDTIEGVRKRQERYANLVNSSDYRYGGLLADAWCAAFVWSKRKSIELPYPITEEVFRRIEENPFSIPKWMEQEIKHLAVQYQFFHWHLAFPTVFRVPASGETAQNDQTGLSGGFNVILGNPPWERTAFEDLQFFATRSSEITNAVTTARRKNLIAGLSESHPSLFAEYREAKRRSDGENHFFTNSDRYPLGATGRTNTYALFTDLALSSVGVKGRVGIIVQTSIATDAPMEPFWRHLITSGRLVSIIDFENKKRIFPEVHAEQKFCLLTVAGESRPHGSEIRIGFWLTELSQFADSERVYDLPLSQLSIINPNTTQPPVCHSKRDFQLISTIQSSTSILTPDNDTYPRAKAWRALMTAASSEYFKTEEQLEGGEIGEDAIVSFGGQKYVPLIEAKQIHQYDGSYATYASTSQEMRRTGNPRLIRNEERTPRLQILPRFWALESVVDEMYEAKNWNNRWIVGVRDVTNVNNERTAICGILPRVGLVQPLNAVSCRNALDALLVVGAINSVAIDYVARQKIPGRHLNVTIFSQLPDPPQSNSELSELIQRCVLELSYTTWHLRDFAEECGYATSPFIWDEHRRFSLRCELDAAFFQLYRIGRIDAEYILQTFHRVKRRDEQLYGEYRTKRIILEIYDEMAKAITDVQPYQTRLDPPPADPRAAHPPRVQPLPLVLPLAIRQPQPDAGFYMIRVILSLLQLNNGSIDIERLMNACELLAMPDRLEGYGSTIEPSLAHQWRTSFTDQLKPDLFLPKIDDLVQRGEIKLTRDGVQVKVVRVSTKVLPTDAHIDFDAGFALRVSDSLPQAEKDTFMPLATRDQIEERTSAA